MFSRASGFPQTWRGLRLSRLRGVRGGRRGKAAQQSWGAGVPWGPLLFPPAPHRVHRSPAGCSPHPARCLPGLGEPPHVCLFLFILARKNAAWRRQRLESRFHAAQPGAPCSARPQRPFRGILSCSAWSRALRERSPPPQCPSALPLPAAWGAGARGERLTRVMVRVCAPQSGPGAGDRVPGPARGLPVRLYKLYPCRFI